MRFMLVVATALALAACGEKPQRSALIVFEIDRDELHMSRLKDLSIRVREEFSEEKPYIEIDPAIGLEMKDKNLFVRTADPALAEAAMHRIADLDSVWVLGPQDDASMEAGWTDTSIQRHFERSIDSMRDVVSRRLSATPFKNGNVGVVGERIEARIPDLTDKDAIGDLALFLARPGGITWNIIDEAADPADYPAGEYRSGRISFPEFQNPDKRYVVMTVPMLKRRDLEGLKNIEAEDGPALQYMLTKSGAERLSVRSAANVGKTLAIIQDWKVIATRKIEGPIKETQGVIHGNFTKSDAYRIAAQVWAGPLPVRLKIVEQSVVDDLPVGKPPAEKPAAAEAKPKT